MERKKLTPKARKIMETLMGATESVVQQGMAAFLEQYYSKDKVHNSLMEYIYVEGDPYIMLVAHMDTVFPVPPQEIYYDAALNAMISPTGLGADDRAGLFAIAEIVKKGYKPTILLTQGEETGGRGALKFLTQYPEAPKEMKYIVELDRQGEKDCVFYNCDNQEFETFVESYGFEHDWGTFTDISHICPKWGVAGVNLSVGYFREHTTAEVLYIDCLYATIDKVTRMLTEISKAPKFEYIPYKGRYDFWTTKSLKTSDNKNDIFSVPCNRCGKYFDEYDMLPVKDIDGKTIYYCYDCVDDTIAWCAECGEPFKVDELDATILCPDCRERMNKCRV